MSMERKSDGIGESCQSHETKAFMSGHPLPMDPKLVQGPPPGATRVSR